MTDDEIAWLDLSTVARLIREKPGGALGIGLRVWRDDRIHAGSLPIALAIVEACHQLIPKRDEWTASVAP